MIKSDKSDDWNWIDAIQMAMPVFTRLGIVYNDTSYFRKMYDLYSFSKYKHGDRGLYNPADQLWWRIKTLSHHIKSRMVKIVTGAVAMVG